jgi:hypothetical protein
MSGRTGVFGDDRGQILLLTAFSMIALLGIAAFALDASFMYDKRNRLYAAADDAAKSGAIEVHRNESVLDSELQRFAENEVTRHGFTPNAATTVVVHRPPTSGAYAGAGPCPGAAQCGYVEVIVSEPTSTFVGRVLNLASMTPAARAVAGTSAGPNCIVTLNPSTTSLAIAGGTTAIQSPNCNIANAGAMTVGNGAQVTVNASGTSTNTCSGNCGAVNNLSTGSGVPSDPLATLAEPANPYGTPVAFTPPSGSHNSYTTSYNIPPGAYSSITIANNDYVTFTPGGLYYITGPIIVGNQAYICNGVWTSSTTCTQGGGVTIFLAGTAGPGACTAGSTAGCINVPNTADIRLSAPTSGPYSAILFFQSRTNQLNANFNNAGSYNLSGAMYFPSANLSYGNAGASNDCTLIVAQTLSLGGGNTNFSNACSAYGGSPLLTISLAE